MADCFAMVSVTHHPTATTSLPPVKRSAARTPQPEAHPPVLLEEPLDDSLTTPGVQSLNSTLVMRSVVENRALSL